MSTTVSIDQITSERDGWPRAGLDEERVGDFAELYREEGLTALPPLLVIERADDYLLADGWHRHEALRRLGMAEAIVEVVSAGGRDGVAVAFEIGLRSSATASKPLTRTEKQAAVQRLTVEGGRTDQEIATLVGVARTTVRRILARGRALHPPEAPLEGRYPPTADEIAQRLVRDLGRLWNARGYTDRSRLPRNLADALRKQYGDEEALIWARRLAAWTADAVLRLEQEAGG
jgi:ParB-like chromosome segregation protein Spo0J